MRLPASSAIGGRGGAARSLITLRHNGEEHKLALTATGRRYTVSGEEATVDIEILARDAYRLVSPAPMGRRRRPALPSRAASSTSNWGSAPSPGGRGPSSLQCPAADSGDGVIRAPTNGIVAAVPVDVGEMGRERVRDAGGAGSDEERNSGFKAPAAGAMPRRCSSVEASRSRPRQILRCSAAASIRRRAMTRRSDQESVGPRAWGARRHRGASTWSGRAAARSTSSVAARIYLAEITISIMRARAKVIRNAAGADDFQPSERFARSSPTAARSRRRASFRTPGGKPILLACGAADRKRLSPELGFDLKAASSAATTCSIVPQALLRRAPGGAPARPAPRQPVSANAYSRRRSPVCAGARPRRGHR